MCTEAFGFENLLSAIFLIYDLLIIKLNSLNILNPLNFINVINFLNHLLFSYLIFCNFVVFY